MLVDIVSKNGNLLLNVPLRGDGTADDAEVQILKEIGEWMEVNSEAIYATRPWRVFGEGPSLKAVHEKGHLDGIKDVTLLTAEDVRFTMSKDRRTLYAIIMGAPTQPVRLSSLGLKAGFMEQRIQKIEQLGAKSVNWALKEDALEINPIKTSRLNAAVVFKISLGKP